jgi:hypothetical protein
VYVEKGLNLLVDLAPLHHLLTGALDTGRQGVLDVVQTSRVQRASNATAFQLPYIVRLRQPLDLARQRIDVLSELRRVVREHGRRRHDLIELRLVDVALFNGVDPLLRRCRPCPHLRDRGLIHR